MDRKLRSPRSLRKFLRQTTSFFVLSETMSLLRPASISEALHVQTATESRLIKFPFSSFAKTDSET